jgi:hypothetical protein
MSKRLAYFITILAIGSVCGYAYYADIDVKKLYNIFGARVEDVYIPEKEDAPSIKPLFPKTGPIFQGKVVHILSGSGVRGTGAVIGPFSIITVAHVVTNQDVVLVDVGEFDIAWQGARVVGFIRGTPEDIVLLQLLGDDGIKGDYFRLRTGYKQASHVVTTRGVFNWQPGILTPGDSGSPILNPSGDVIGLVHGYYIFNRIGIPALFTRVVWVDPKAPIPDLPNEDDPSAPPIPDLPNEDAPSAPEILEPIKKPIKPKKKQIH